MVLMTESLTLAVRVNKDLEHTQIRRNCQLRYFEKNPRFPE